MAFAEAKNREDDQQNQVDDAYMPASRATRSRRSGLDEVLQAKPVARVYRVLLRLEKARVAAALDVFEEVFATLREAGLLVAHLPRSALRCLVDAAAARWCDGEPGWPWNSHPSTGHIPAPVSIVTRQRGPLLSIPPGC